MFVPKVEVFFILLLMQQRFVETLFVPEPGFLILLLIQQKVCRNPIRPRAGIFDFAADTAKGLSKPYSSQSRDFRFCC